MTAILRADELTKHFGSVTAVRGLSLAVGAGEVFGLVGPDGAGKSTTLRLLCGLLDPDGGSVEIGGRRVDSSRAAAGIGYVPQQFALSPELTVWENCVFTAEVFGVPIADRDRRIDELLGRTGLARFKDRRAGKLSGGMKRKLALICALVHRPPLLLLDEPTSGVDPVSRREFWRLLYGLAREGMSLIVSTTYLDEAERCDRVGILYEGRLVMCDEPAALRRSVDARVVDIWCDRREAVRRGLAPLAQVRAAQITGDRLRVFLAREGVDPAAFVEAAVRGGAPIRHWSETLPTIEDVFLKFLKERGQTAPEPVAIVAGGESDGAGASEQTDDSA